MVSGGTSGDSVPQLVFLIRHAQADYRPGRLAGRTPGVHLSDQGTREAERLAERLRRVSLTGIYSSPLERCMETAETVAAGRRLEVRVEEGLLEVDFGSWQGRPYKTLARTGMWHTVQHVPSQARFPGGETILELQRRGVEALEAIRARHRRGRIAVVSHADMIKAVAAHYLGLHVDLFQRLAVDTASVTVIAFGDGFPRVLRVSDTGDYDAFAAPRRRRESR